VTSHFSLNKGVAVACAVAATAVLLNGICSAQNHLIAADYATNSIYASGWTEALNYAQRGQNGGYGFGGWNMWTNVPYDPSREPGQRAMDRTSPYDPFGVAWTLYNPHGLRPNTWPHDATSNPSDPFFPNSPGTCYNPPTSYDFFQPPGSGGYDLAQAGRALPDGEIWDPGLESYVPGGGLKVGETFSTIIANPSDRAPYGGYTIALENWPENRPSDHGDDVVAVGVFEYGTFGRWYTTDTYADYSSRPNIYDLDTTTNGMQIDITVTSTNTYHLVLTPLGNPGNAFSEDGTFAHDGPIVWVTYELYNTDSNFYPSGGNYSGCGGPGCTDFYIKSMTVSGLILNVQSAGSNVILSWPGYITGFNLESTPSLNAPVSWTPVVPGPVVVSNSVSDFHNYVTNAIEGTPKFYRLKGSF
jgi:hypothetical protein